jgi:hypothetical protein
MSKILNIDNIIEQYFREFLTEIRKTPSLSSDYIFSWTGIENTIDKLSIEEQSKYADYITMKICSNTNKASSDVIVAYGNKLLESHKLISNIGITPNLRANIALVILSLSHESDIRKRLLAIHVFSESQKN